MLFNPPLIKGYFIKRYKRFFVDVKLENGEIVTAHCANTGSMLGLLNVGAAVLISPAKNPQAKLAYKLEAICDIYSNAFVGVNTQLPNLIVAEAISQKTITEFAEFNSLKSEVAYGTNSRIDILLSNDDGKKCYVEVKNVTLVRNFASSGELGANSHADQKSLRSDGIAEFPDAVTERGLKHLHELCEVVKSGHRAAMIYFVNRSDTTSFGIARDIDPKYYAGFVQAVDTGVEVYAYKASVNPTSLEVVARLEVLKI